MKTTRSTCFFLLFAWILGGTLSANAQPGTTDGVGSFRGVARLRKLSVREKQRVATVYYPVFHRKTPLIRFLNARLGRENRAGFAKWQQESRQGVQQLPTSTLTLRYDVTPSLLFFRPAKVVSLREDVYEFSGGAHGMFASLYTNLGIVNGLPKPLVLGDFFRSGAPYRLHVENRILAKLRKNPAATWIQEGSVKNLSTDQFNNFGLGKNGLTWTFNPYEMGPYANGQIEVTLSPAELGPDFKREWLR